MNQEQQLAILRTFPHKDAGRNGKPMYGHLSINVIAEQFPNVTLGEFIAMRKQKLIGFTSYGGAMCIMLAGRAIVEAAKGA